MLEKLFKIYSYKIFLYGLLNDLNIYKHFDYFFITKYLTSTGRIFSDSYNLQFQGNKLAFGFITFYKQKQLTKNDIAKVNEIIKKVCQEIPKKYFIEDAEIFIKTTRMLYNKYVLSFCKPNTDLQSYPYDASTITQQIQWLLTHCNKPKEALHLKILIENGKTGTFQHMLYGKDSTSSGPQIISILTRDYSLALRTNIVGSDARDLYQEELNAITIVLNKMVTTLDAFFKHIMNCTKDEFIQQAEISDKTSSRFKLLELFKCNDIIILEKLYKEISTILEEQGLLDKITSFTFP